MARVAVVVRSASPVDVPAITPMWDELAGLVGATSPTAAAIARARRTLDAGEHDGQRFLVAWSGDEPVGMAWFTVVEDDPWTDGRALVIRMLHVRDKSRHRGIAKTLLAAVVAEADARGCQDVGVSVPPSMREANRFFARLGFSPVVTQRLISTTALRRRLAGDARVARRLDLRLRQRALRHRHVPAQRAAAQAHAVMVPVED